MSEYEYVKKAAEAVLARAGRAAERAGRPMPRVVAVTKSATDEEVLALLKTGLVTEVAENRVQCLTARKALLDGAGYAPVYHLIGSLQTNKVKYVVGEVAMIQSLDSERLAAEIERRAAARGVTQACLVEVNSGREENKGGLMPEGVEDFLISLRAYPHIHVAGLMTMSPVTETPEGARPYFREVKQLFDRLTAAGVLSRGASLSMGMSDSYEVAIEEGADIVRVGRAFFRKNEYDKKDT